MKIFSFYLPQYHVIPENNKWWGEGYTEWDNVKNAISMYKGHEPKTPLNGYYYNLLDKKTVEWQAMTASKYGIDGFIFYHYYFNGKLILEKPIQNLLKWEGINLPFFICWANHSWERKNDDKRELLIEQIYGAESDWSNHFNYLLQFFKDKRYEKIKNRPVFMVFRPYFKQYKDMMVYFDKRCREKGFDGLCVIEVIRPGDDSNEMGLPDSILKYHNYREPDYSMREISEASRFSIDRINRNLRKHIDIIKNGRGILRFDANDNYKYIANREYKKNDIPGIFFEWDNTPRYNSDGYVIEPVSKEIFEMTMNRIRSCEYLTINAWNEWGEGMILEPSEQRGYQYLEWIYEWRQGN